MRKFSQYSPLNAPSKLMEDGARLPTLKFLHSLLSDKRLDGILPPGDYLARQFLVKPEKGIKITKGHDLTDMYAHLCIPARYLLEAHEKSEHGIFFEKKLGARHAVQYSVALVAEPLEFEEDTHHGALMLIPEKINVVYRIVQNLHEGRPDEETGIPVHERKPGEATGMPVRAEKGDGPLHIIKWVGGIRPIMVEKNENGKIVINAQHPPARPGLALPIAAMKDGEEQFLASLLQMAGVRA